MGPFDYPAAVLEHYENPRNVGEAAGENAVAEVRSEAHGDRLTLSLRISPAGVVEEARFRAFGCVAAIAAGSMTTELLRGRRVEEAARITDDDVAAALGGLPPAKVHCSVLAREAISRALAGHRTGR